tara:strand:- start:245 stop:490 length:246 start_codon:yes stop_codon:yes gene_type:complete
MDEKNKKEIESATFQALVDHLQSRKDVQNIDLMNLAGFCRNCLSKWYRKAAQDKGFEISDLEARERVYGMPYSEWKSKYQK